MMGLEPTTFCMARTGRRSSQFAPFAETFCSQRLRVGRANASEPDRTSNAAIAAIVIVGTLGLEGPVPGASSERASAEPGPELVVAGSAER